MSSLSYANIISARGGDPWTQFTIMGGKLRSANHCIIGEMFVLKRLFFSSLSGAEQSTITITSEDENPVLSSSEAREKVAAEKRKVHDRRKEAKVAETT